MTIRHSIMEDSRIIAVYHDEKLGAQLEFEGDVVVTIAYPGDHIHVSVAIRDDNGEDMAEAGAHSDGKEWTFRGWKKGSISALTREVLND